MTTSWTACDCCGSRWEVLPYDQPGVWGVYPALNVWLCSVCADGMCPECAA